MCHCKVERTLCSVQQVVWWSLHWVLRPGWEGGMSWLQFWQYQGVFQLWRRCSAATTAHRALPVYEWPALGMPWAIARSNAVSAACSSSGWAYTACCARAGEVVCGGCGFASLRELPSCGGAARQPRRSEPCQCVSGQPWAYHEVLKGQTQALQCAVGVVGPALAAAAGLGSWFAGEAVLIVCGDVHRRRQYSATAAHRALPVCQWPALGMSLGTARSNAASAVCSTP